MLWLILVLPCVEVHLSDVENRKIGERFPSLRSFTKLAGAYGKGIGRVGFIIKTYMNAVIGDLLTHSLSPILHNEIIASLGLKAS